MTALQTFGQQPRTGAATAKSITLPSSPTLAIGDDMYLQWVGGATYVNPPAGWAVVEHEVFGVNVTVDHAVFHRVCQAGDPGSVVTVDDGAPTGVAKSVLNFVAVRSVNSTGPISKSGKIAETTSTATHASGALTSVATTGKVLQFIGIKDATASASLTIAGTYTNIIPASPTGGRTTTGGATAPIVGGMAISTADIAAGTVPAVNWTSDQASANASMISIAIAPASSVVGVRTTSDTVLPTGATFAGGTTLFGTHGDDDVNSYDRFIASGVAQVEEEAFPALPGPLTGYTGKLVLDGAASVDVVVKLKRGATVIYTGSAHTISAAGEQSYHDDFDSTVQTAQIVDLTAIRIRKEFTLTP